MAQSPTGVIPEELMQRGKLGGVMEFLKQLPIPGDDKESLLLGWARTVGVRLQESVRSAVRDSGVDRQ